MDTFDLVIDGATLITPSGPPGSGSMSVLRDHFLGVSGGRIAAIGPREMRRNAPARHEINGHRRVVIPGLINAHTHLFQTLVRGRGDGFPLGHWAVEAIWTTVPFMAEGLIHSAALVACSESLEAGVTTVVDVHYLADPRSQEAVAEACLQAGIRAVLGRSAMDTRRAPMSERVGEDEAERLAIDFADRWHGRADRMTVRFEAMNEDLASPQLILRMRRAAAARNLGFGMHLAETQDRARRLRRRHQMGPVEWLRSIGCLGPDVLLSHCVWLGRDEIRMLADSGTGVAHNPISNAFLGDGTAMLIAMIHDGVQVGIGTDGAASNNSLSVLESAKAAVLLQRARARDPGVILAGHVLEMATIGGARALGMKNEIGTLEVGKQADLLILDLDQPATTPSERLVETIIYSGHDRIVDTVVVGGSVVVSGGRALLPGRQGALNDVAQFGAQLDIDASAGRRPFGPIERRTGC